MMWGFQHASGSLSYTKKGPGRRHNGSRANPSGFKLLRKAVKHQIGLRKQS